jgi:7-carboxy-7-deazaguanine synthase
VSYKVKEVFYSIQGEAHHTGQATIFCRFSGCNLWNGKESDRHKSQCSFCDTDFNNTDGEGGGVFTSTEELVGHLLSYWPKCEKPPVVEFTGGEPLLQLDVYLIRECKKNNIFITVETNGTKAIPAGVDWVCMSPKANVELAINKADEIKVVYPQNGLDMTTLENFDADFHYLQVMDNEHLNLNRKKAVQFCLDNPKWKLSLQIHKVLEIK